MPSLLHSVPNHPWIGKFLFDLSQRPGLEFRGVIQEVSDDQKSDKVYVRTVLNEGETAYLFVNRASESNITTIFRS